LSFREWLRRLFRKNEGKDKLPCPTGKNTNSSPEADNHNYFVLEKHVKEIDDNGKPQQSNGHEHYALAQYPTYYEVAIGESDDYDTTDQVQIGGGKPSPPSNVYNTFKDFQQQDDYDHIGDHKKPPRIPENEYNTTQGAMALVTDDDTYNHLNEGTKTTPRPDNVYGTARGDNDYDKIPPVSGTHITHGIEGDNDYTKIAKIQ